jgi:hypothetical protein
MNSIKLENFNYDGLQEQISVAKSVYSSLEVVDPAHIRWKHLTSPYGKSTCITLRNDKGILLGRSFLQPRKFWVKKDISYHGAMVTDLVIDPQARNASALIDMTRAFKSPTGIKLVVHTSNEVSDPIYRNLFKFPVACTLTALGLPLYFAKVLRPYLKNLRVLNVLDYLLTPWRWGLLGFSSAFELASGVGFIARPQESEMLEVFNGFKEISESHFERSLAFHRWRFGEGPIFNGEIKWIKSKGICIGCVVFKQVEFGELSTCVLLDIVMRRNLTRTEKIAIKLLVVKYAIRLTSDVLFTLANTDNPALKWLNGFPFIVIPDKLLPHPTPIFIHSSEEIYPSPNHKNIYLTLADLDYF